MLTQIRTRRVLVVDDERTVCQSVEKILRRKGHDVEKARSGSEAIDALEKNPAFDVILADLMMPQMSGLDLLRVARDRWPSIPVVIMTGYASIASAIEATRAGAIGYLPKPFTPDELETAIARTFIVMEPMTIARPETARRSPAPATEPADASRTDSLIDVDMPFGADEVEAATSADYVRHLTRSDMALVDFCDLGRRTCRRVTSKGTCKQPECPLVMSARRKQKAPVLDPVSVGDQIDVDMPFSFAEVAAATSEAYADALGRGDIAVTGRWNQAKAAGRRVLVVDDEAVVVSSMRRSLSRRGFVVDEAFSGNDALNRILGGMYDLVLLDMRMPDAGGLELLPTIRKHRPGLPVVMVTGYASIDTAVEAIQRGATDYMAKPFTPDELCATANRAISSGV